MRKLSTGFLLSLLICTQAGAFGFDLGFGFGGAGGLLPPGGATLSLPFDNSLGAGTFARASNAWNPETGLIAPNNQWENTQSILLNPTGATITQPAVAPPVVGAATHLITETTATSAHNFTIPRGTSGVLYLASIYIKGAGVATLAEVDLHYPNTVGIAIAANGVITLNGDDRGTPANKTLTAVGDGWYRLSYTALTSSSVSRGVNLKNVTGGGGFSYTGTNRALYYATPMLEATGSIVPSSPMFTTGTAYYAPRYVTGKSGQAILIEESGTNYFLNSQGVAAVTQNISVTTANSGKWTCTVYGAGTVTSSAGTATATGYGAATVGTSNTITVTGNGTVTYTVSGATAATVVNVENLPYGTSMIVTAGATVTRAAETLTYPTAGVLTAAQGTVAKWINVDTAKQASTAVQHVFTHGTTVANNLIRIWKNGANTWGFHVSDAVGALTGADVAQTLSADWHLFGISYGPAGAFGFIDGVQVVADTTAITVPAALATNMFIGSDNSGTTATKQIDVAGDGLRVYSAPLTAAQHLQLFRYGR